MGAYDESTFFVAYWYPKIAVYDDIYKWDLLSYNGEHEFYNDYSNMKVEIKVPAGFAVWATGELTNPEYVLSSKIYDRYVNSLSSDEVVNIVTKEDVGKIFITLKTDILSGNIALTMFPILHLVLAINIYGMVQVSN
jgi:hypothetical protein